MGAIRVLSGDDVDAIVESLSPEDLVTLMRQVFSTLSSVEPSPADSQLASPARTAIISPNHTTLFMPSRIAVGGGTGIKIVSVPRSDSDAGGLPATTLVLNERTGAVEAVVNARQLTAVRNAAGSALATRLAGVQSPTSLVLFGAGAQIHQHARVFLQLYPSIAHCTIINRTSNERVKVLADKLRAKFPTANIAVVALDDSTTVQGALAEADLVCCATSSTEALFDAAWLNTSAHLNLIGSYTPKMREVAPEVIDHASLIIVDSLKDCKREAGELLSTPAERLTELGSLCLSGKTYQRPSGQRTIFKSVGVGIQDVAIARLVVDKALGLKIGTTIAFD